MEVTAVQLSALAKRIKATCRHHTTRNRTAATIGTSKLGEAGVRMRQCPEPWVALVPLPAENPDPALPLVRSPMPRRGPRFVSSRRWHGEGCQYRPHSHGDAAPIRHQSTKGLQTPNSEGRATMCSTMDQRARGRNGPRASSHRIWGTNGGGTKTLKRTDTRDALSSAATANWWPNVVAASAADGRDVPQHVVFEEETFDGPEVGSKVANLVHQANEIAFEPWHWGLQGCHMDLVVAAQKGHYHRFRQARDRSQEPICRVVFGQDGVLGAKGPFGHGGPGRIEVCTAVGLVLVVERVCLSRQ
jgi:hypothetical protein